jgi:hypothetical protein
MNQHIYGWFYPKGPQWSLRKTTKNGERNLKGIEKILWRQEKGNKQKDRVSIKKTKKT